MPSRVVFLEGCFITRNPNPTNGLPSFSILKKGHAAPRTYFVKDNEGGDDIKLCDLWVRKLQEGGSSHSFESKYMLGDEIGTGRFSTVHWAGE